MPGSKEDSRTNEEKTRHCKDAVARAVEAVRASGEVLSLGAVVRASGLNPRTVRKHWEELVGEVPNFTGDVLAQNRAAVMEAAKKISDSGARLTQRAVADEAGISISSVRRHWDFLEGKYRIFPNVKAELLEQTRTTVREAVEQMRASGVPLTQFGVSRVSGLCVATVLRHWQHVVGGEDVVPPAHDIHPRTRVD